MSLVLFYSLYLALIPLTENARRERQEPLKEIGVDKLAYSLFRFVGGNLRWFSEGCNRLDWMSRRRCKRERNMRLRSSIEWSYHSY